MQNEAIEIVQVAEFIAFAGREPERWQLLVGCVVDHQEFSPGLIYDVAPRDDEFVLQIAFGDGQRKRQIRRFTSQFLKTADSLHVPMDTAQAIREGQPGPESRVQQQKTRPETPPQRPEPRYEIGQEVSVASVRGQRGLIARAPFWGQGEWQYELFFSAANKRVFRESDLVLSSVDVNWVGLDELLRNLALVKLRRPLSDNLYAIYGSRTKFEVYQFKPALKFLANPDQRLLIADEVGLGKTIEAGIIYLELQARLDLSRVLVVCPSKLRHKWQDEMKLRFDEEFAILDSDDVRRFLSQYEQFGGRARLRGIVSLELLRRREFAEAFVAQQLHLDLVVIDEAHHCRNTGTLSHQIANVLSEHADAMLLLTATPLQMGNEDLFNLLHILSPGEFDDADAFLQRLEPNQYVNRAARMLAAGEHRRARQELRKVERTMSHRRFTGNPYYRDLLETLQEPQLSREELITSQRRLVDLNTLANVFTRTRKREIAEKVPVRQAFTLKVPFSPPEAEFYQRIIDYVRDEFISQHGGSYVSGWVTIMRERQAASCISAARDRFAHLADEVDWSSEEADVMDPAVVGDWDEDDLQNSLYRQQRWYRHVADTPFQNEVDTKFDLFWEALRGILEEEPQTKLIVFSYFRDTIDYLYRQLRQRGVETLYMHGGVRVRDRADIIDRFRDDESIRVLISSDVGSEGLDFQFCNTIFNYDLPWNPMRLEQRIGRIDRFGQESSKVRVFNMVIDDTVESRILMRLYERIGIFKRAVGDIEAIVGEEVRELSRKVYTSRLSPEEEVALAEQSVNSIIRRQQEMEEFEKKRLEFMGQEAIFSDLVQETISSGRYISDVEIRGLVTSFVRDGFPQSHLERNEPPDGTYALEIGHKLDQHVRGFVLRQRPGDQTAQTFMQHLKPGKVLPVTFSSDMASRRKLLHFITPRHPLAQAAAHYWKERIDPSADMAYVTVRSDEIRPGDYLFFIFELNAQGVEKTVRLVPVAVVLENGDVYSALSEQLLHLIQTHKSAGGARPVLGHSDLHEAEESAKVYMTLRRDQIEAEILRSNEALVNARLAGLAQSNEAKQRRIKETLRKVKEPRIIRLHEGRLRNTQATYESMKEEVESLRDVSVSFGLLLRGLMRVAPATSES